MSKKKINLDREELIKLYIIENKTVLEIAKIYEIGVATVNRFLKLYEIKKPKNLRQQAISNTKQQKTEEEKQLYSQHVSEARKGKGLGIVPWNKGKHVGNTWKGKTHTTETKQKISQTKQNKSAEEKAIIEQKRLATRIYAAPWNKNKKIGPMSEEIKKQMLQKEYITKKQNNSFNSSAAELQYYNYLINKYSKEDVIRQYSKDSRYPFACDFYIKSIDTFIELNLNWTHGGHLFDKTNKQDLQKLSIWQEKAKTSKYYQNAIETWTIRDPLKYKIATDHKLNYICYYSEEELYIK